MTQMAMTRRRLFATLGAIGTAPLLGGRVCLAGTMPPARPATGMTCVLSAAMTEGPYFVDARLNRSDLTTGTTKAGVMQGLPLALHIDLRGVRTSDCLPLAGVQVDVWHADATGEYSDSLGGAGQPNAQRPMYLRGYQISDAKGRVSFKTIYPGWYSGRTAHIHVKARVFDAGGNATYEFTSQLFFDDATNERVMAMPPYNARGTRGVRNSGDFVYRNNTGAVVDLAVPPDGARGYVATIALGLTGQSSSR
jgi:protocatechuate 3,4-dioxygenase beta subunit